MNKLKNINTPIDYYQAKDNCQYILRILKLSDIKKLEDFTIKNTKNIFYVEEIDILLTLIQKYPSAIYYFCIKQKNFDKFLHNIEELTNTQIIFYLKDSPVPLNRLINLIASKQFPITLSVELFKNIDSDMFKKIVDLLFTTTYISAEIKPFFELMIYAFGDKEISLWKLFDENINENFYINKQGFITLSNRFNNKKVSETNSIENFEGNDYFEEVQNYTKNIFLKNSLCSVCKSYEICKGFLKFNDEDYNCNPFIETMDLIQEYTKQMINDYNET